MVLKSKVKNHKLGAQAREIVYSVYKFLQNENKELTLKFLVSRIHMMTGVSDSSIKRIIREGLEQESEENGEFKSPDKKRCRKSTVSLDNCDKGLLRRTIIDFHIIDDQAPSLNKIFNKFQDEYDYQGAVESLRKEILSLGFRFRKTKTNRRLLIERHDIRQQRLQYLTNIKKYREERQNIVYSDVTYCHSGLNSDIWSLDTNEGFRRPISKGQRLMIVAAGNEHGFVPNSYAKWYSQLKSGDNNEDMNFDNYKKWLVENFLNHLPKNSIIVINNALNRNKQSQKNPTSTSRKCDMIEWLRANNIPFSDNMLRPDLYQLIKLYKSKHMVYDIEEIIRKEGHKVLRLPPYHPEFNPFEMAWAVLKSHVTSKNAKFTLNAVEDLCDEFFVNYSAENWKNLVEKIIEIENYFIAKEPLFDNVIEKIIEDGGDSDSDSEYSTDSESETTLD